MNEQWRKQMQQKMADYRQPAPELSWDEIEQAVAAQKREAVPTSQHKAKWMPLWLQRVAAVAVILIVSGAGYWAVFQHREEPAVSQIQSVVMQKGIGQQAETPAGQQLAVAVVKIAATMPDNIAATAEEIVATTEEIVPSIEESVPSAEESVPSAENVGEEASNRADTLLLTTPRAQEQHQQAATPRYVFRKSAKPSNRLTARVYFSNGMSNGQSLHSYTNHISGSLPLGYNSQDDNQPPGITDGNSTNSGGEKYNPQEEVLNPGEDPTDIYDNDEGDEQNARAASRSEAKGSQTAYKDVQTDERVEHHQPIRFGVSLRYQLNDRWSLESGLTYSLLTASITRTTESLVESADQSLSYVGIPLSVSYRIWGSSRFSVYASAGTLVEKMVSGRRSNSKGTTSVSIHPLQLSLNGAIGAEYLLSDRFSLFFEPGLGYYFDNGSSVPTLYQEQPWVLNLNLGLRLNLR